MKIPFQAPLSGGDPLVSPVEIRSPAGAKCIFPSGDDARSLRPQAAASFEIFRDSTAVAPLQKDLDDGCIETDLFYGRRARRGQGFEQVVFRALHVILVQ